MKRVLFLAMILIALISTLGVALAQPPGPHSITGKIARTDGTPAPEGAQVWATVDDYTSPKSPKDVVKDGVYFVSVGPTDGKYIGRPISFWVDEDGAGPLPAAQATPPQAITFTSWALTQDFNLVYTPPPPPTPTPLPPTPTPTPLPGATPIPTLPPTGTSSFFYMALGVAGLGLASLLLGAWAWRKGRVRA